MTVIDFEMERKRRLQADDPHEWCACDQLIEVMEASQLSDIEITSAALHALLAWLEANHGMSRPDAKQYIAQFLEECE